MRMMSQLRVVLLALLFTSLTPVAHAWGHHRYGGWGYYDPWVPFVLGGAVVGTGVYLSRPYPETVIVTNPAPVVVAPPVGSAPVAGTESYYCRESAQYFPAVQTCVSPWLVVYPR